MINATAIEEELVKAHERIKQFESVERKLAELCTRIEEYFNDGSIDANVEAKLLQQGDVLDVLEDWKVQEWLRGLRMSNKARFARFPCRS